jgi:predicted ATPase
VPLLADLLQIPWQHRYRPLPVSERTKKEWLFNTLLSALFMLAEKQPLALIIEDLQWADPATLELLTLLIENASGEAVCTVFTARPEFTPDWAASDYMPLRLRRLSDTAVTAMVLAMTAGKTLPDQIMTMIQQRTDGVPLFIEELTGMLLDTAMLSECNDHYELMRPLRDLLIPATLRGLLTAKLDKLGRAKQTAQLAAVIGREFPYRLLAALSPLDQSALDQDLETLQQANLIFRRHYRQSFIFKHALIRDIAYDSMLQNVRQEIHQQIGLLAEPPRDIVNY